MKDDEPFGLTIETRNECFTTFFETQDEAESYLRRWAKDNGYVEDADTTLEEILEAALVDVSLYHHYYDDDLCQRLELFERPPTAEGPPRRRSS
jgi:hypothetical protein